MTSLHQRLANASRLSCPFCWEYVPSPESLPDVYSGDGLGGRCECGAVFMIDETGRAGGQTLVDCLCLACDGDLARAMDLDSHSDYEIKKKPYQAAGNTLGRMRGSSYMQPQVWFLRLTA